MAAMYGIVACFAVFCVLLSPARAGVEIGPQNVAVLAGGTTVLECVSDGVETANLRWYEYATNDDGVIISDGAVLLPGHPNSDRYTLVMPDSRTINLQIADITLGDAGYYQCLDSNAAPPSTVRLGANLVVLEAEPNCTQSYPEDGFTIEGQYHTAECTVYYRASEGIAPLMTWTGPEPFTSGSVTTNTSVWSGMQFYVERSMNARNWMSKTNFTTAGFSAPDTAGNAPSYQFISPTNQVFVYWPPDNMTATPMKASYAIGEQITCWADAWPTANYVWQSLRTSEFWYDDSFTTREDMVGYQLMRCTATNSLGGYDYTKDLFLDVYVDAPTTTPTTTPAPTTTTPEPWGRCGDVTGRWEAFNPTAVACLTVDHENNGLIVGLYRNGSDTFWMQLTGKTREGKYDELGWAVLWPQTAIGVSSFAVECHRCNGVDMLLANGISRTTKDSEFCASGGNAFNSADFVYTRTPMAWPCAYSIAEMNANVGDALRR
jgi:hypothetical protein